MAQYLVIFGALVNFFGSLPYVMDTLRGKTKPNRVSWGMWSLAPVIGTVAALMSGVTWAVLPVFMSGFMPFVIFLSSFWNPNAYWKLEKFDYMCGAASALALILWAITAQPLVAIAFAILSDALAGIPNIIKCWKYPETETGSAYIAGFISALTAIPVIKVWTFAEYGFPIYLIIMSSALMISVWHQKVIKIFQHA